MIRPVNPLSTMTIKPFEGEDVPILKRWAYDPAYADFFRDMYALSDEQLKIYAYMKDGQAFVIRVGEDQKPIGFLVLYEMRAVAGNLKMAILVEKEYQKKSLCFEAMRAACEYAFFKMRYHKVIIEVLAENTQLQASCAKGGFVLEPGCLKEEARVGNVFKDVVRMTMFEKDYVKHVEEGFYGS